jgi:hypothetical protein
MVFEDTKIMSNYISYKSYNYDYKKYLETLLDIIHDDNDYESNKKLYKSALETAILLGPQEDDDDMKAKINILKLLDEDKMKSIKDSYYSNYGLNYPYLEEYENLDKQDKQDKLEFMRNKIRNGKEFGGGSRRNKATPKSKAKPNNEDMTMKDIKELCKANQIKLSKVVEGKRVVYKKKELITKLKRKKLL